MWWNYLGCDTETKCICKIFCYVFIDTVTVKRGLQAGGWSQTEDRWEVYSNREVCSQEGTAIFFLSPCETSCPCFGEDMCTLIFSMKRVIKPVVNFKQNSSFYFLSQEMMYVWNGFTVVGKRPELTESILATLEKAEEQLKDDPSERNSMTLKNGFGFVFGY